MKNFLSMAALALAGAVMMTGCSGSDGDSIAGGSDALRTSFESVGGQNLRTDNYYWSRSVKNDTEMWCYDFLRNGWYGGGNGSYSYFYVRACLKF